MRGTRTLTGTALAIGALTLAWVTSTSAAVSSSPTIGLGRIAGQAVRPGYGETVRIGQQIVVSGAVTHPPRNARVELEGRTGAAWHALLTAALSGEHFTLRWRVRTREFQLRAALLSGRRPIATSAVTPILVGSAIVRCRPAPAPVDLPAGDGWIEGGVYLQGGPAPGIDQCESGSSTITVSSTGGYVVTSEHVVGGDGYALVVPSGTYQLRDGECTGQATVIAGRRTLADTDCDFP